MVWSPLNSLRAVLLHGCLWSSGLQCNFNTNMCIYMYTHAHVCVCVAEARKEIWTVFPLFASIFCHIKEVENFFWSWFCFF